MGECALKKCSANSYTKSKHIRIFRFLQSFFQRNKRVVYIFILMVLPHKICPNCSNCTFLLLECSQFYSSLSEMFLFHSMARLFYIHLLSGVFNAYVVQDKCEVMCDWNRLALLLPIPRHLWRLFSNGCICHPNLLLPLYQVCSSRLHCQGTQPRRNNALKAKLKDVRGINPSVIMS